MSLTPRVRVGVALHVAVNLLVAAGALALHRWSGGADEPVVASAAPAVEPAVLTADPVLLAAVHPLLATTTTLPPTTTVPAAPRRTSGSAASSAATAPSGASRAVVSTGYCLETQTASGSVPAPGTVAMNGVRLGSRWLVHDGPFAGQTLLVTDRIGHGSQFDIWFADCDAAIAYGRRTVTIEAVG